METKGIVLDRRDSPAGGDDDEWWRAVIARDPRYDSRFVYGVRSTMIYCRPTCASKKPARRKVSFFLNSLEAKRFGYEPCRRCHPDVPGGAATTAERRIQSLCEYISDNYRERLTLARLGGQSGLSPFHLQRTFKKIVGVTPREYVERVRLDRLRLSLKSGGSVRSSTYASGYSTSAWLYFRPEEKLGMSPSTYRRGGEGLKIHYVIRESPLGRLLVAATERGICLVHLADSDQKLMSHLKSEYPKASLVDSSDDVGGILRESVGRILDYLSNGTDLEKSNLPLDLHASAFEMRVWRELRSIPYGQVRAYSEVARRMGRPKATRAVANACATNPVPLVVPCHRVVPKGGGVGQYGLGVERKEILLRKEGVDLTKL